MQAPTLDDRVRDLVCVLDAAGAERPTLLGIFSGGMTTLALAATDPDRVRSLFLYATAARSRRIPPAFRGDSPMHRSRQEPKTSRTTGARGRWRTWSGAAADVPGVRDQWGRIESSLASPTMAALLWRTYMRDDVRDLLGRVRCADGRRGQARRPNGAIRGFGGTGRRSIRCKIRHAASRPARAFDIVDMLSSKILEFCERPSARK